MRPLLRLTRLILERLEEAGHLEGTFPLFQQGRVRNAICRIDGYSFDEERSRLELFTTIYREDLPPVRIPQPEVNRAFERAIRFVNACVEGLAAHLEPSNSDASDLAKLIEAQARTLGSVKITLLTNGVVDKTTGSTDWRDHKVEFDTYDVVRLQRILGQGETRADRQSRRLFARSQSGRRVRRLSFSVLLVVFGGDIPAGIVLQEHGRDDRDDRSYQNVDRDRRARFIGGKQRSRDQRGGAARGD
jgi:hypothetical protein